MTKVLEKNLVKFIQENIPNKPTLILLSGELGSGKTTFSRKLLNSLGFKTQSPTYVLISHFQNNQHSAYHLDLYRLEKQNFTEDFIEELHTIINDEQAYVLIEWPEKLSELNFNITRPHISIKFQHLGDKESRNLEINLITN